MQMYNRLIDYMFELMKDCVLTGIEEEPEKFRYTQYANMMIDVCNINLSEINEVMFKKVLNELISYLR